MLHWKKKTYFNCQNIMQSAWLYDFLHVCLVQQSIDFDLLYCIATGLKIV